MPGASGGPHGHGVDRHGAPALDPLDPTLFRRGGETERKAACSHATALTLWSSAGVVAEACWKSARKARDITKRLRRQTRRWIRACYTCVPKKNGRIERRNSRVLQNLIFHRRSIDFTALTLDLFLSLHFHF